MKKLHLLKFLCIALVLLLGNNMAKAQCHAAYFYKIYNSDSVVFYDSSTTSAGKIAYFGWDFGDGYKSNSQNPVHVYSKPGTYYVCHNIYTSAACKDTICDSVHISVKAPACNGAYSYNANSANADSLFFYPKDTSKTYKTYKWSFGDGKYATAKNPWHYFAKPGKYYVCLKVTDSNSTGKCDDIKCDSVQIGSSGSAPICDATVGYYHSQTNADSLHFYPKSTKVYKTYLWSFGDGKYSTDQYPWHYYTKPGKYYVCLKITDSTANGKCSAAKCDSVQIGSTNTTPTCDASFTSYASQANPDSLHFYTKATKTYKTYSWNFGDGTYSGDKYPLHYYTKPGKYYVCLKVTDSNSAGKCYDIKCDSVEVRSNTAAPTCNALFGSYTSQTNIDSLHFYNKSTKTYKTYSWSFGDGNYSTDKYPLHYYAKHGKYYVCLKVTDSTSTGKCYDIKCDSVEVGGKSKFHLSGLVSLGKGTTLASGDYGRVWAIKYDSAAGTLTAVDSTNTDSTHHYLFILPVGDYIVKAALNFGSTNYKHYLPTYHENKLHWDSARVVHLNAHKTTVNIYMVSGKNHGGPGFIGGYVSQGANKTEAVGDPVADVEIILYNDLMEPLDYTYSKADGNYAFNNLPYGTYYIHPEVVGKETYQLQVTLDASKEARKDVNITVNSLYVIVETGIDIITTTENIIGNVYPNPAYNVLNILMNAELNITGKISIVDIQGKTLLEQNINNKNNIVLDIAQFPQGIYNIMVQTKNGEIFSRRFVKQ
ncbi:MAG: PKD domain-containing protein [Bacteroidota bacterium]|nr:PKD domain-containing protein [Bacteroidota bacterium]